MSVSTQPLQKRRWWDDEKDIELNDKVWQQIKANDPSISCLLVKEDSPFLKTILWRKENETLSSNTHLKRITIDGSRKSFVASKEWAANKPLCPKYQRATDLREFCKALSHNSSIDHLILKRWDYRGYEDYDDNVDCPILPIIDRGYCYNLRRLVFINCTMGKRNWTSLAHSLNCFEKDYSLEHLHLLGNDIYNKEGKAIISSCIQHPNLEEFSLVLSYAMRMSRGGPGLGDYTIYGNLIRPTSKLKYLNLQHNKPNDTSIKSLSTLLHGNKTLETLNLGGNKSITASGWSIFFTNLRMSGTGLISLYLFNNNIDDEGIAALGKLLASNKTIRKLNLHSNEQVTQHGWEAFASSGQNNTLEHLNLSFNRFGSKGLIVGLKNMMKNTTSLERLNLSNYILNDEAIGTLGDWMVSNNTLKCLNLNSSSGMSSTGLTNFFNRLQNHPNPVLEELQTTFGHLSITEALLGSLVSSLMGMRSLKKLVIGSIRRISNQGWQSVATLLQHQNCMLKTLAVSGGYSLNDASFLTIANALVGNSMLRELLLDGCSGITESGWSTLAKVLYNKSSIDATYASNHTLRTIGYRESSMFWRRTSKDLQSLMQINRRGTKAQAAREKIIRYHMLKDNIVNVDAFVEMELNELPSAISWLGRDELGLSVLFKLCKSLPDLFESRMNVNNKKKRAKRKRVDFLTLLEDV